MQLNSKKKGDCQNFTAGNSPVHNYLKIRPYQFISKTSIKPESTFQVLDISNVVIANSKIPKVIHKFKQIFIADQNNYTVYKRSISNIVHSKIGNMLIIFRGLKGGGKSHSLIGSLLDPGILPVLMLQLMQQKYSRPSNDLKIVLSFMEYRNQKILDLLTHTQIPLQFWKNNLLYPLSSFQVNQFLQFLKLFKIALFYNRSRDIAMPAYKNAQLPSHFIAKIKLIRKIGDHYQKSEICFVDFSLQRQHDSKLGLQFSQQSYLKCMQQIRAANYSLNKKSHVNYDECKLITLLKPFIQNSSINNFSCVSECQNVQKIEQQLKVINKTDNAYNNVNIIKVVSPNIKLLNFKDACIQQFKSVQQALRKTEFQKFADLSLYQQKLSISVQSISNIIDQLCKKTKTLCKERILVYSKQSALVYIVKQKISKVIKNSNIKQFYCAKTYGSFELQIKNNAQKATASLSTTIINFMNQCQSSQKYIKQMKKSINKLNETSIIIKPLVQSCFILFNDTINSIVSGLQGLDLIILIKYYQQLESTTKQIHQSMNQLKYLIKNLDKTILNCYKSSYLNTPLNIISKITTICSLPIIQQDQALQSDKSLKFRVLKKKRKDCKQKKIQYLSNYLLQRSKQRETNKKYLIQSKEITKQSQQSSQLTVIPQKLKRIKKKKSIQRIQFISLSSKSVKRINFAVKI